MELEHSFIHKCYDINELLDGCTKLSTYCNRLVKQSEQHTERHCPMKYRGDGFELLIEALFKSAPANRQLGAFDYTPITGNDDTGVDAIGLGINGKPAAIQIKYRSDSKVLLTANNDHLMNFGYTAQNKYNVDVEDKRNMIIVTNAKALHHFTNSEMFLGKVHVIKYADLKKLIDGNMAFWIMFRRAIDNIFCEE